MEEKLFRLILVAAMICYVAFLYPTSTRAEDTYPPDYTQSTESEGGRRKSLDRVFAVGAYLTQKLDEAGGEGSPPCYRDCMMGPLNRAIACVEANDSYASSESCEREAANKMARCDPTCETRTP